MSVCLNVIKIPVRPVAIAWLWYLGMRLLLPLHRVVAWHGCGTSRVDLEALNTRIWH